MGKKVKEPEGAALGALEQDCGLTVSETGAVGGFRVKLGSDLTRGLKAHPGSLLRVGWRASVSS